MRDGVTMLRCTHDVHSQSVHVRRRSGKSPSFGFSQVVMYAYLCRSYPCPGSIAIIAFRHPSWFWASFGSSSCCFRSLRTRSIHLSLGLPRGLPPSSLLHVLLRSFRLFSSHGETTKGVSGRHTQPSTLSSWSHWPRGPVDLKSHWPPQKSTGPQFFQTKEVRVKPSST